MVLLCRFGRSLNLLRLRTNCIIVWTLDTGSSGIVLPVFDLNVFSSLAVGVLWPRCGSVGPVCDFRWGQEIFFFSKLPWAVAYREGGFGVFKPPPRNSEDTGGVLDRMSKKGRRLDFLLQFTVFSYGCNLLNKGFF